MPLFYRMPNIVSARKAIIYQTVLVNSYSAINTWNKKFMAVLANSFFKFRIQPYLVFHYNPSGHLGILVR